MIVREAKARVRIGGITKGNPPMLAFSEMVTRSDGKRKLFSQMVQVVDAELLARLQREAHNGDEADVVVESRLFSEELTSILKDFSIVGAAVPATTS